MAEEVTSIRLGCTTSPGSGHEPDVERLLEKAGCEAVMLSGDPLQHLLNGEVDALVMDAQMQDLPVGVRSIGALPRQDPSLVLVCSDKPSHRVRGARIVVDHEPTRRQLVRFRSDLVLTTTDNLMHVPLQEVRTTKLLEAIGSGQIDGFVTSRSEHRRSGTRLRRHSLTMQRGAPERSHFVPPTHSGTRLIIMREGESMGSLEPFIDEPSTFAHEQEQWIHRHLPEGIRPLVSVNVDHRKIGGVLRELNLEGMSHFVDEARFQAGFRSHEAPGGRRIREERPNAASVDRFRGPRAVMRLELVSADGRLTAGAECICPLEDVEQERWRLIEEWGATLNALDARQPPPQWDE